MTGQGVGAGDAQGALEEALADWCARYVTAFVAYDATAIARHWAFPALIVQDGKRFAFSDDGAFTKNTGALLGFYEAQGVAAAERSLLSAVALGEGTAAIGVEDIMRSGNGGEIVRWRAGYVLSLVEGDWRAVMADAGGETRAWAARGTPLGG
ncbi:MAG: hypothetical protein AAGJ32_02845 [Pseudomonadota bacterium]